jgi:hypothetical protein
VYVLSISLNNKKPAKPYHLRVFVLLWASLGFLKPLFGAMAVLETAVTY